MSVVKCNRPRTNVFVVRQLSVGELERYIRIGCFCSVCELARSEIRALEERTSVRTASPPRRSSWPWWRAAWEAWRRGMVSGVARRT